MRQKGDKRVWHLIDTVRRMVVVQVSDEASKVTEWQSSIRERDGDTDRTWTETQVNRAVSWIHV